MSDDEPQAAPQDNAPPSEAVTEADFDSTIAETLTDERATSDPSLVVDVEGFEGPLDLLLMLARTQKVDLSKISILALADQYLVFIEAARKLRLELAADYLVMAAWLAYLKSRLLLPGTAEQPGPSAEEELESVPKRPLAVRGPDEGGVAAARQIEAQNEDEKGAADGDGPPGQGPVEKLLPLGFADEEKATLDLLKNELIDFVSAFDRYNLPEYGLTRQEWEESLKSQVDESPLNIVERAARRVAARHLRPLGYKTEFTREDENLTTNTGHVWSTEIENSNYKWENKLFCGLREE